MSLRTSQNETVIDRSLQTMYFTIYRSPLLIVILNAIVITWNTLANFCVGDELYNVLNMKGSNDGGHQISLISFMKTSLLKY